jgi:CHRD domain
VGTLRLKLALVVAVLGAVAVAAVAIAHDRGAFKAKLTGFTEVPAVITDGNGRFEARISRTEQKIEWTLHYEGTNTPNVLQAHIHIGQAFVAAGVSVFLCTNLGNGPTGTQACPPAPADISGTITPADVVGPLNQGIGPGQFDRLVRAMRSGLTYANVHTELSPVGEIRGQIGGDRDRD